MGRRKGSKNKPKDINNNGVEVRKVSADSNQSADIVNIGISILDLTESVKERTIPMTPTVTTGYSPVNCAAHAAWN